MKCVIIRLIPHLFIGRGLVAETCVKNKHPYWNRPNRYSLHWRNGNYLFIVKLTLAAELYLLLTGKKSSTQFDVAKLLIFLYFRGKDFHYSYRCKTEGTM